VSQENSPISEALDELVRTVLENLKAVKDRTSVKIKS